MTESQPTPAARPALTLDPSPGGRGKWKRTLLMLLLLLTGGAIINVAVAWGLAAWRPMGRWGSVFSWPSILNASEILPRQKVWLVQRWNYAGVIRTVSTYSSVIPSMADTVPSPSQLLPPGSGLWIWDASAVMPIGYVQNEWEVISGWPCLSLAGVRREEQQGWNPKQLVRHEVLLNGIGLGPTGNLGPTGSFDPNLLPLRPLWPGFAINTIFYAAIIRGLWLLFAAPGKIRRIIRGRRGQCPACAYPIGTSEVCTECGGLLATSVPRRPPAWARADR